MYLYLQTACLNLCKLGTCCVRVLNVHNITLLYCALYGVEIVSICTLYFKWSVYSLYIVVFSEAPLPQYLNWLTVSGSAMGEGKLHVSP